MNPPDGPPPCLTSPPRRLGRGRVLSAIALLAAAGPALANTRTDSVLLKNGNLLTCEVRELRAARLLVKTDALGDVHVEWDKVAHVITLRVQEVQVGTGDLYYGPLEKPSKDGRLLVQTASGPVELDMMDVVRLRALHASFWNRIDGSLDLGGSYTQASRLLQLTPALSTAYATRGFGLDFNLNWTLTRQEGETDAERLDTSLRYTRFFEDRWLGFGEVTGQRNTELGLEWRTELALGAGRALVATNHSGLVVGAGVAGNRERASDGSKTTNFEGLVVVQWRRFSYDFPKTDLDVSWVLYPSFTDWGRVRGEASISIKREVLHDFTIGVHAYDSFDTRPATEDAETNDWGATLSLGWSF